ncbi:MAG: AbrB/MazE/SpoVT family DNA-binding domain-containing protein [Bifidobacteriaceae bacterium]|nr:AbrB/MazE/SpoVT family DNA-binding domain-containing protein [Bifidobacteriaceae bacterium]
MAVATMTSKGQVTVPKAVRLDLDLKAGSQVDFVKQADGGYRLERLTRPVSRLAGALRRPGNRDVRRPDTRQSRLHSTGGLG